MNSQYAIYSRLGQELVCVAQLDSKCHTVLVQIKLLVGIGVEHLLSFCPQDLLDPDRWKMLIQQFRYDNYRLHQLGNNSVFTITLQAGLSAIKTPYPTLLPRQQLKWSHLLQSKQLQLVA